MTILSLEDQLEDLLSEPLTSAKERERSTFDELTAPFEQIVLFGAGNMGRKALRILRSHGIEPLAFADNATAVWGQEIDGLKVLSPADAAHKFGQIAAFIVTVFSPGGYFLPIRRQLCECHCTKVVPLPPLCWKYPQEFLPHMLLDLPHRILQQKDDVRKAFSLLEDEASRSEYVAQVRWRLLQDYDALPPAIDQESYFPEDLFRLTQDEVFVDCGAYDGDTIKAFLRRRLDFGKILAYEPDPMNFARLESYLAELPSTIRDRISARRSAVGASKGKVRFEAGGTVGSKVSRQGEVEVECDTLDALLDVCDPTYVKMDIEGAELEALQGARKMIRRNCVTWAICLYHKPADLWQIPIFIHSHSTDYSFFVRKYMSEFWETVCYAVPKSRMAEDVPNSLAP
ncbi:MAG: FkbM family methyltransferase [Thermoguttaceae bacterium]|jgi:FkbM family methyltransferase